MPERSGMTLMEVLVAILVMGIGLLSVLAMFPMGSLTMLRAIRDDREGHAAANARAIGNAMDVRFDANFQNQFINPNSSFAPAPLDGPSYPIFADPVGFLSSSTSYKSWVGGTGNTTIYRSSLSRMTTTPASVGVLKFCTLQDDITFDATGKPSLASGGIERAAAVSYAWLLQRPRAGNHSACNMTVVVFNQRAISTGLGSTSKEVAYISSAAWSSAQPNLLNLTWGPGLPIPQVKEGGFVLDATWGTPIGGKVGPGDATFYRVATVGDFGASSVIIELATPLHPSQSTVSITQRTIVIMDGVSEVLDCGLGWKAGSN